MEDENDSAARSVEAKEYRRELERSMHSMEEHIAEIAGSLEKLRATNHNLVSKMMVLDDLSNQFDVVSVMANVQKELVTRVGRLGDLMERLNDNWERESSEIRRRLGALEASGKRVE